MRTKTSALVTSWHNTKSFIPSCCTVPKCSTSSSAKGKGPSEAVKASTLPDQRWRSHNTLVESLQKYQWCRSFSVVNECWFGKIPKNKHLDKRKKKQQAYRGFHQVSSKLFQGLCEAFIGINFIGIHFCLSFTIQPDFHIPCHYSNVWTFEIHQCWLYPN